MSLKLLSLYFFLNLIEFKCIDNDFHPYNLSIYLFLMGGCLLKRLLRFNDWSPDWSPVINYILFFPNGTIYYGNYKISIC